MKIIWTILSNYPPVNLDYHGIGKRKLLESLELDLERQSKKRTFLPNYENAKPAPAAEGLQPPAELEGKFAAITLK